MEREPSVSSDPVSLHRQRHPVLPPWEKRTVGQVPFMEPRSPPLVERDNQGFFIVRPRSNTTNHRPKLSTSTSAPCNSEYVSPVSEHSTSNPWRSVGPPPSAPPAPLPTYETQTFEREAHEQMSQNAFTKSHASQPPPKHLPQAPPTPPDSVSRTSFRSASASPPVRPKSKAMPGTMSSRNRSASISRGKSSGRERRSAQSEDKENQSGLGKRFKSAFRDIFKKDPVDESQFERIADRHWTDEF